MSNRLALLKAGAYCAVSHLLSITAFSPTHYISYRSQHSLMLTEFAIIVTGFTVLTKKIAYQNIVNSFLSLMMTRLRNSRIRAHAKKSKYVSK